MSDATRIISKAADLLDIETVDLPVVNTPLAAKLAFGLDSANHTGTQAIATVTGLQTALDDRALLANFVSNASNPSDYGKPLKTADADGAITVTFFEATDNVETSGLVVNDAVNINATTITYGAGAAAAHRTAMGLGTGDSPTFAKGVFIVEPAPSFDVGLGVKSGTNPSAGIGMSSGHLLLSRFSSIRWNSTANAAGGLGDTIIARTSPGLLTLSNSLTLTNLTASGTVTIGQSTVATLPTASASTRQRIEVTDALSPTIGSSVASGGTEQATVRSDGTDWIVIEIL